MPASIYPNGFANGVTIRGIPLVQTHPGKAYWVSNVTTGLLQGQKGGSDQNKGTFDAPFSTLDYAIGQCVANRGDVIFVKPGHAETFSTATALNLDVAGVAIIGLGVGSNRPTFTLDTATTTTVPVSSANVAIQNCIFTANFADIVSVFTLTTAKYFTLENCYFKATAADMNFIHLIDTNTTTAAADGLSVLNCKWYDLDAATLAMALVDGTNDDWSVVGCHFNLGGTTSAATLFTCATGKSLTNVHVTDNFICKIGQTDGTAGVLLSCDTTACTGIIARNYTQNADANANILLTATAGISVGPDNYHSGVANEHGVAITVAFNNA